MPTENDVTGDLTAWKRWRVAVRPFAYTGSVLAVVLGAAIAHYTGSPMRWGLLGLTLLGVVCFHTGANLLNDCFDHRRGLDTQVLPTSGAIVRGWLTERQVFRGAMVALGIGVACGLALTWLAGWMVLALGLIGAACAFGYTTPRFCFKYWGGGDLAVFLAFGVLSVFGSFWVQAGRFDWLPLLWSIPLAMFTVGIVHANNWRDIESDRRNGCVTVAGLLGAERSRTYYRVLVLGPFVLVALFTAAGRIAAWAPPSPPAVLIAFLVLPLAWRLALTRPREDAGTFCMLDAKTAQAHLGFGILCSIAFWIGR